MVGIIVGAIGRIGKGAKKSISVLGLRWHKASLRFNGKNIDWNRKS